MLAAMKTPIAIGLVLVVSAASAADGEHSPTRGELLYSTHCIACHNSQMHWRDQRLATDWKSLKEQVRRWQRAANLGWNEADILEVTRHLNERIYRYRQTDEKVTSMLAPSRSGH